MESGNVSQVKPAKAYRYDCEGDYGYSRILFASSPGRAKAIVMGFPEVDGWIPFTEIRVYRLPKLDHLGKPDGYELDWNDQAERYEVVKAYGWSCGDDFFDPDWECPGCTSKGICDRYAEYLEEGKDDCRDGM